MIGAHTGIPYAAERQIVNTDMKNRVIDARAAGLGLLEHPPDRFPVAVENIQRQRTRPPVDVADHLLQILIGQHRQQRAKNFLPHDFHFIAHVKDQGQRHAAIVE